MKTLDTFIRNPATGEAVAPQKVHNAEEFSLMVAQARSAQAEWAAVPVRTRCKILRRLSPIMAARADELARTIGSVTGKLFADAYAAEVLPGILALDYYCRVTPKVMRRSRIRRSSVLFFNKRSTLYREPLGVVGIISPWNYSFSIPFQEVVMALAAGNAAVLKVATQVQPVGDAIAALFAEIEGAGGLPPGLFAIAHLGGRAAGEAMLSAGIDKLFFTGSTEVGKELMAKAASTLTPVCLELGGKDPMIVCADANLVRAVYGAMWAGFSNCGQSCAGVERIYVERAAYEPFVRLLGEKTRSLRIGYSPDPDAPFDVGSLSVPDQLATVERHLADALAKGALVLAESSEADGETGAGAGSGAGAGKGLFHRAVVLGSVSPDMSVIREETFGPVLTVEAFDTDEEAITRANASVYALSASVWTKDRRRAGRFAAGLKAGSVTVNDHLMSHGMAETPWGGPKESGIGRTHGRLGLEEMTVPKVVVEDTTAWIPREIWWHPYGSRVTSGLKGAVAFLYGKRKLRGAAALVRLFAARMRKPR